MNDFEQFHVWLNNRNLQMIDYRNQMQKNHKNKNFLEFDEELRWHVQYATFLDMFEASRRAD